MKGHQLKQSLNVSIIYKYYKISYEIILKIVWIDDFTVREIIKYDWSSLLFITSKDDKTKIFS